MQVWWYFVVICGYAVDKSTELDSNSCKTPDGKAGICVSLLDCKPILDLYIFTGTNETAKQLFDASLCDTLGRVACCPLPESSTPAPQPETPLTQEEKRREVLENLIPSRKLCGKQHTDDYEYKGNETSVDEFPWMVYLITDSLRLNSNNKFEANLCVGMIFAHKYVLTEKNRYSQNASFVKVGQHHTLKDTSCILTPFNEDDCTNPAQRVTVEKSFSHENSSLVLLKLDKILQFNNFVRPICLPFPGYPEPPPKATLVTSGWGAEEFVDGTQVQVKKRVKHVLMNQAECARGNPIRHPICGVTFPNSSIYTCVQDIGGPVMYKARRNWIAGGIITGLESCAKYQPITGERFTNETLNWILDTMYDNQ